LITPLPTFEAWEAPVLPLNYTHQMAAVRKFTTDGGQESPPYGRGMVLVRVEGANSIRLFVDTPVIGECYRMVSMVDDCRKMCPVSLLIIISVAQGDQRYLLNALHIGTW